jgi:inner membrane protein
MDRILELLVGVTPWHWLALAAILIAIEITMPTFFFLWPGIAAALVGAVLFLMPSLGVYAQVLLFSVLAVVTTVVWKKFAPESLTSAEPHPTLNRRAEQYAGRRARAAADFSGGRGAILIDDTRWSAMTADGSDPHAGETLVVTGADGSVLTVSKP